MSDSSKVRVMIADGHPITRDGIRQALERADGLEIVGEAGEGDAAVDLATSTQPDVVIMEVAMPVKGGIEACREIKEALPDTQVMVLTASADEDTVLQAVAAGATGYLQKSATGEKLVDTLRDVVDGELRVPARALVRMAANARSTPLQTAEELVAGLTAREREVLALFAQGMNYAQIAQVIGYRPLSVRNVIYGIQNKLNVKSKQELAVRAFRGGLLDQ